MQFKDLKQGYPVYILNKSDITLTQGTVRSVTFPHADSGKAIYSNSAMVVDVTIEADGKTATYTIPESLQITYAGNVVLSTERECMQHEVESMKANAENIIASVEHQQKVIDAADILLAKLNPVYHDKLENEKRFANLESSVNKMSELLSNFINSKSV